MNLIVLLLIILILAGGFGVHYAGPGYYGYGGGIVGILVLILVLKLLGVI